jgi:alginate O-acetyltransferase complex protein AlgI
VVFSSHLFVYFFLPLTLAAYYAVPRRAKNLTLTAASFLFYGWANPAFSLLLVTSTLIDYFCGLALTGGFRRPWRGELPLLAQGGQRTVWQRRVLILSMVSNLSLLGFFKYFNFGVDSWNTLLGSLGLGHWRIAEAMHVVLPLGISFYTFQSMSYAIDVYRGDARAMRNLLDFFCFETMFPQLVAGPIVRFSEVARQLRERTHSLDRFARGIAFFALGMSKKVLLANPCGFVADAVFEARARTVLDAWYGVTAYAFQIYYDFSGYSDMAVGLGLMLGFVFAKNFDSPYHAASLTEFWQRWHLSLSTWLRDYLYIPLGGNRRGPTRTYVNLLLVMLLGGLWHGAAWTFVFWGALHGLGLAAERAATGTRAADLAMRLPGPLRVGATFALVLLGWVFFRSPDLASARDFIANMFGLATVPAAATLVTGVVTQPYYLLTFALAALTTWAGMPAWEFTRRLTWSRGLACLALLALALVAMATQGYNPFIYFIF